VNVKRCATHSAHFIFCVFPAPTRTAEQHMIPKLATCSNKSNQTCTCLLSRSQIAYPRGFRHMLKAAVATCLFEQSASTAKPAHTPHTTEQHSQNTTRTSIFFKLVTARDHVPLVHISKKGPSFRTGRHASHHTKTHPNAAVHRTVEMC
jgi:hypothetical protein